jgi:hypothetical protein
MDIRLFTRKKQTSIMSHDNNDIPIEIIEEIQSFLPINDLLVTRLIGSAWNEASQSHNQIWKQLYTELIQRRLPQSSIFQTYTIDNDHPKLQSHPLLAKNKKKHFCEYYGIDDKNSDEGEESIDEKMIGYLRTKSDPVIEKWVEHLDMNRDSYYMFVTTVIEYVMVLQRDKISDEEVEYLISMGLRHADRYTLLTLFSFPLTGIAMFLFTLLCILKHTVPSFNESVSWNFIFPCMYLMSVILLPVDFYMYVADIYFYKAGIHTIETLSDLMLKLKFNIFSVLFFGGSLVLFHLRGLNIEPFASHATYCILPISIFILLYGISLIMSSFIYYIAKRRTLFLLIFGTLIYAFSTLVCTAVTILVGLQIDNMIRKVNWAIYFIPFDLFAILIACMCGCTVFIQLVAWRFPDFNFNYSSEDVVDTYTNFIHCILILIMQILLGIPSIPDAYSFYCILVMIVVIAAQLIYETIREIPAGMIQSLFSKSMRSEYIEMHLSQRE